MLGIANGMIHMNCVKNFCMTTWAVPIPNKMKGIHEYVYVDNFGKVSKICPIAYKKIHINNIINYYHINSKKNVRKGGYFLYIIFSFVK